MLEVFHLLVSTESEFHVHMGSESQTIDGSGMGRRNEGREGEGRKKRWKKRDRWEEEGEDKKKRWQERDRRRRRKGEERIYLS